MTGTTANSYQRYLPDETATVELGRQLGTLLQESLAGKAACVYLLGDLGAGKTTFCRGVLQSHDYHGAVKSPTYTLVEPYELGEQPVYHFDLYRLADAAELEFLGLDTYFHNTALCLVEWPERGSGFLPDADLVVTLAYIEQRTDSETLPGNEAGENEAGEKAGYARMATIEAGTDAGRSVLAVLASRF